MARLRIGTKAICETIRLLGAVHGAGLSEFWYWILSEMDISIVFHALLWVAALGRYAQSPGMFEWRPCDEASSALVWLFRRKCAATSWTTSRTVWIVHMYLSRE